MTGLIDDRACPCGGAGDPVDPPGYDECCGRLHRGEVQAPTALALMRSRYSAFVVGDADYVWRTWHPRTRPEAVLLDPDRQWLGLEVTDVVDGGPEDQHGVVEFTARYRRARERSRGPVSGQHERSAFARRAGRWFYLDAIPSA